jgi:hypothetical protein
MTIRIATALFLLIAIFPAAAQQFVISTYAGGNAAIGSPQGVAADTAGNIYFSSLNSVFKLDPAGGVMRVAGNLRAGFSGDGGPATSAQLFTDNGESGWPAGLAVDKAGNLYIADRGNARVRKVSADGMITTVAGNGSCCSTSGDGGPATSAQLNTPIGLALDNVGNLFIADAANRNVRRVSTGGTISTIAGSSAPPDSGDGGPAGSAGLRYPTGLAAGTDGSLYIADGSRVRGFYSKGPSPP